MNVVIRRCYTSARQNHHGKIFPIAHLVIEDDKEARYSVEYWGKDAHDLGVGDELEGEIISKGSKQIFKNEPNKN